MHAENGRSRIRAVLYVINSDIGHVDLLITTHHLDLGGLLDEVGLVHRTTAEGNHLSIIIRRLLVDEAGQDLIEYALLTACIGLMGIVAWANIQTQLASHYAGWGSGVNTISSCTPDPCSTGASGNFCASTYAVYCSGGS